MLRRYAVDMENTQQKTHRLFHTIVEWTKRHFASITFFGGFIFDNLTLTRVDLWLDNIILLINLFVVATGIILLHLVEARIYAPVWLASRKTWLILLIQFPLGTLFSGFLIYYSRSASWFTSWPFLLTLIVVFIGTELLHRRYERLIFQISMFFFALMSYMTFLIPVLIRDMGDLIFLVSGIISLMSVTLFIALLWKLSPQMVKQSVRGISISIVSIYTIFNAFYFLGVIPPLPLTLKNIGTYHSVERTTNAYRLSYEKASWLTPWRDTNSHFYIANGDTAYCFSAIFAPTRLSTQIYHQWQYKDSSGAWVDAGRLSFPIVGGRDGGYRGYTLKKVFPGTWKCTVETERGAVLGSITFIVSGGTAQASLVTAVL